MANDMAPAIAGAGLSGLVVSLLDTEGQGESVNNPVLAMALGVFSGKLLDILEQVLCNPYHRQLFHCLCLEKCRYHSEF